MQATPIPPSVSTGIATPPPSLSAPQLRSLVSINIKKLLSKSAEAGFADVQSATLLAEKLVAMKRDFPQMLQREKGDATPFSLDKPITDFHASHEHVSDLLKNISPALTSEKIVDGFWKIIEHTDFNAQEIPKHAQIDLHHAPKNWPADHLLLILRLGNWKQVDLNLAVLSHAHMKNMDLSHYGFNRAQLKETKLNGAIMRSVVANHANLAGSDMTGVHAENASFVDTDFKGANLTDTCFKGGTLDGVRNMVCHDGTDFSEASVKGADIAVGDSKMALKALATIGVDDDGNACYNRAMLNHLNTGKRGSEKNFALDLARHVMTQTQRWPNTAFQKMVVEQVLPPLLRRWNTEPIPRNGTLQDQVVLFLAKTESALPWLPYCEAARQLLLDAGPSGLPAQQKILREQFANDPDIARVAASLKVEKSNLLAQYRIFSSPDQSLIIAYEDAAFNALTDGLGSPFNGYQLRRNSDGEFKAEALRNPEAIEACSVPYPTLDIALPPRSAVDLIAYIVDGANYEQAILHDLCDKTLPLMHNGRVRGRLSDADTLSLTLHLGKFIKEDHINGFALRDKYMQPLWEAFEKSGRRLPHFTSGNTARMILCLGALFTRYGCSNDTREHGSLMTPRLFAGACLKKADQLDPKLLGADAGNIMNALIGKPVSPDYSADKLPDRLLNRIQALMAEDGALETCFTAIYPQAWAQTWIQAAGMEAPPKRVKLTPSAPRVPQPSPRRVFGLNAGVAKTAASPFPTNTP
jgi:uncharacterized protein YjbI with pentapeptide repeats